MQLDADEGADPFYKPAPQSSAAEPSKLDEPASRPSGSEETDVEAAATATIEQEA
jgi:hypothetical protein